jgi:hypothetical protein
MFRIKVAVLFVALAQACAHQGPKFTEAQPPRADEALVYFYRAKVAGPAALSPAFYLESQKVVDLPYQGYTQIYVKSGEYNTRVSWGVLTGQPSLDAKFNFAAGRTYFIRLGGDGGRDVISGVTTVTTSLTSVPPSIALRELGECCMFIRAETERLAR